MIKFLIESSICMTLFYCVYWFFLRREKLLSINRFYLLGAVLLSLLIPLLEVSFQSSNSSPLQVVYLAPLVDTVTNVSAPKVAGKLNLVKIGYYLGMALTILFLGIKVYRTRERLRKPILDKKNGLKVVETEGYQAFSFWNTIVLGDKINSNPELRDQVIHHELSHVEGRHSLDLLILEILRCVYWFNPIIYLYERSLKSQHEYIADNKVLKTYGPRAYERALATIALGRIDQSLVHSFAKLPLDQRIKMIYKTNSNIMNKFKLLIVVPVLALLVFQFGCADDPLERVLDLEQTELSGEVTMAVLGVNVSSEGVAREEKNMTFKGSVWNSESDVLEGVTIKAVSSGNTAISNADGSFSIRVTKEDKELLLSHPDGSKGKISWDEDVEIPSQTIMEIPDDLSFDKRKELEIQLHEKSMAQVPLDASEIKRRDVLEKEIKSLQKLMDNDGGAEGVLHERIVELKKNLERGSNDLKGKPVVEEIEFEETPKVSTLKKRKKNQE